jgi:hypothetical protein
MLGSLRESTNHSFKVALGADDCGRNENKGVSVGSTVFRRFSKFSRAPWFAFTLYEVAIAIFNKSFEF